MAKSPASSHQLNQASTSGIEADATQRSFPLSGPGGSASARGRRGASNLRRSSRNPREKTINSSASSDHESSSAPAATLLQGRVCHLNLSRGYGFLRPTISPEDQSSANSISIQRVSSSPLNNASGENEADRLCSGSSSPAGLQEVPQVYFKLFPSNLESHSSCYSGLMNLQLGDTLEYISDPGSQKPRAIYTRLIACSSRSTDHMASYLKSLLLHCLQDGHTDAVLREIIKAPRGLLLMLEHPDPDQALILLILKLATAICDQYEVASFNTSRVKEFFRLLIHSPFFMTENGGLCKLLMRLKSSVPSTATIETEWGRPLNTLITSVKSLVLRVLGHIPQELPFLVCLIQILDQMLMVDLNPEMNSKPTIVPQGSFAMQVIQQVAHASGVGFGSINVSYDKLSLLPSGLEIKFSLDRNNKPPSVGLPVAKWKGGYDSTEEYIDTYLRLLREDSFGSLIKGISDFLNDKLDYRDMTVWYGVSATGVRFQQYLPGLMVGLQLNYGQANQRHPKLPLAGSLLCICDSGGHFENPLWAIAARSVETSKRTVVLFVEVLESTPVMIREQFRSISSWGRILQASSMVVAESPAYYRAYEPVLKALQRLDPATMPFQSELAMAKSPKNPPNYLNETTILDWSCLKAQDSYEELKAGVNELAQPTLSGFRTCLDNSQVEAVNHVLHNQLAMIQGPPGTGKTFLTVKIVELLLSANTRSQKPVLIVTYKNRALDQFLGSCLRFCEPTNLVRVGGRSTDPKLDCCNLQHLLRTAERKFTSELIPNCKKLDNLQTELVSALRKLYHCQAVSMETILCQGFLKRSQSINDTRCTPDVLKSTTTELSNDALKDSDMSDIAKTKECKTLKEWMPRKGVFDAVKGRFTSRRPVRSKSTASDDHEDPDELEEDNEDRNESESLWQDIKDANRPGFKGKKEIDWLNNNWLNNNYFNLADFDLGNKSFVCQSLANFDSNPFTWLLEEDPFELPEELRCILILVIMKQNLEEHTKEFLELKSQYDAVCADNVETNNQKRVAILQEAKIIGMTTTGAAINQDIIAKVSPSIILVEEAAEILEPHVIALLSSNVEHLILIGDHKQLRPSVDCYQLETKHNLGISMLERLAENNGLPYQTLGLQSRMREEFLPMIQPIYPNLRSNLKAVNGLKNQPAKCMESTMYFWNHTEDETTGRSPINLREAHMVVALSKWLLSEGHTHEEITVICAYNGQVSQIRKMLGKLKGIDVQTIDRYQGSENRIVIVSLVRSNTEGNIGHLMALNRLCVTVSRARAGMYICGDAGTLSQKSPHWRTLIEYFRKQSCIGDSIFLVCPRHPKNPSISLHNVNAEKFSPHVCGALCNATLECGHLCSHTCHYGKHALCKIKVQHVFPSCQHSTEKLCSDTVINLKCLEEVWNRVEKCGHIKKCVCWEKTGNVTSAMMCKVPCGMTLPCMHPCTLFCGQDCGSKPCPACARIEQIKAEKERQRQIEQIKESMRDINNEIEKLKSSPEIGPVFKELGPAGETAPEYRMVQDRTEKFIQPTHKHVPVVTRIQKVINAKLELNFLEAKRDLTNVLAPTQMLFHGTDDAGVTGITTTGFRLPSASKNNMFGVGCYFATDSSKSAQQLYTKGSNKLLLCEVLLGRPWSVTEANPNLTYNKVRNGNYDSVFSMRNSRASGGTEFDEYIIYNPNQAIPRYVVHYQNRDCLTPELQRLFHNVPQSKFGRRFLNADASSDYKAVTSDDMHFRLAESQFLRMCDSVKPKVEKVEYTWNQELEERYQIKKQHFAKDNKPLNESWVFHGTTKESIDKIVKEGFRVGGEEGVPIRFGAAYGHGVYTAANPEISIPYSKSSNMMLLSIALCGKLNMDYNVGGSKDIFVVKQGDQLLPKYIVHFRST